VLVCFLRHPSVLCFTVSILLLKLLEPFVVEWFAVRLIWFESEESVKFLCRYCAFEFHLEVDLLFLLCVL
jgi:hypothetical protein